MQAVWSITYTGVTWG